MITIIDQVFQLDTLSTSYIFRVDSLGYLRHGYYGSKLKVPSVYAFAFEKVAFPVGSSVLLDEGVDPTTSLDMTLLEYSTLGKGDYREPSVHIEHSDGYVLDFRYVSHQVIDGGVNLPGLPNPHGASQTLLITLEDKVAGIQYDLYYSVFEASNVILRATTIRNISSKDIKVKKAMSMQLDMLNQSFDIKTTYGGWMSENHQNRQRITPGIYINDSKTGHSSNRHNPYVLLLENKTTLTNGSAYGFNLIYSGNHYTMVELTTYDKVHIHMGINPLMFEFILKENSFFASPWAVLTYSNQGENGVSQNFHHFVNHHVIRGPWANKSRPILLNNWEATYFDFDEWKLLRLLKEAKALGIELLVLDDGWFGRRKDDKRGLGDYDVNRKKLPHGLHGLAKKVEQAGLKFGLWFEPEMVSEDSLLFETHPEWAITAPERTPAKGRHQLMLDLSRVEVQDYLIEQIRKVLSSATISYVKWDFNRHMSDFYSPIYPQGEFIHRYTLGLYRVLETVTTLFPDVLWEGCSSGGNRTDLGMLSYFQQNWTSDNTDGFERIRIQQGAATAYPLSTIGAHVSASPSHQMLRKTSIETRFDVAAFGLLGYEMDLYNLSLLEEEQVTKQIAFYKAHRKLLQFGKFYQLKTLDDDGYALWMVLSEDKKEGVVGYFQGLASSHPKVDVLHLVDLIPDQLYVLEAREQQTNIKLFGGLLNMAMPIKLNEDGLIMHIISKYKSIEQFLKIKDVERYVVYGDALNSGAVKLNPQWYGTGVNEHVRVLADFGANMYYFHAIDA